MWAALLFGVGATALGLLLWRLAWRYIRLRAAMRGWPRASAQVLDYRSELSRSSRSIDVKVRYQYNGRQIETWCRSPTGSGYGRGDVQASRQVAAKFPRHSSQQVYVNPATPEEAFLELPEPHMLAMLIGGGAILVGMVFAPVAAVVFGGGEEMARLAFMIVLGLALSGIAVFAAIALWRTPRPRRIPPHKPRRRRTVWR
jgi:uncharacterized protein DUF3592